MNEYDIKRLALVLSIQAQIEGMKVENLLMQERGLTPTYQEYSFQEMAMKLTNIAHAHNDQL